MDSISSTIVAMIDERNDCSHNHLFVCPFIYLHYRKGAWIGYGKDVEFIWRYKGIVSLNHYGKIDPFGPINFDFGRFPLQVH